MTGSQRIWHTSALATLVLVVLSACAGLGPGDSDRPTFTTLPDANYVPGEPTPAPSVVDVEESAGPGPATYILDPWEITVLATDRDAGRTLGQGNHPDDFPQVMTTISLTNTSTSVRDQTVLEFTFGDPGGTQNGYRPGADWCADHPLNYLASPWLMLPGETRVVTVCVPVNPRDAEGLIMWVANTDYSDPDVTEIEVALPDDGQEWDAVPGPDYATLHHELADRAGPSGTAFGYEFEIADVSITDGATGNADVKITLDAEFVDPEADPAVFLEVTALGPSGSQVVPEGCQSGVMEPTLEGEPWTHEYCMAVPEADANSLLFTLAQWYSAPDSLTLNAYTD